MKRRSVFFFPWSKYPAVRIALLFTSGILLTEVFTLPVKIWIILWVCLMGTWAGFEFLAHTSLKVSYHGLSLGFYLLVLVLFGSCMAEISRIHKKSDKDLAKKLEMFAWEDLSMFGVIDAVFMSSSGRMTLDLTADSSFIQGKYWREKVKIRLYGQEEHLFLLKTGIGSRLEANIRLYPLSGPQNPGEFNYEKYLEREAIYLHGELTKILRIREGNGDLSWGRIRKNFHNKIDTLFTHNSRSLAKALLTGYKRDLDTVEKTRFSRAGLSHIMAVSGLHVGFIIAPFWLVLPWLRQIPYGKIAGLLLLSSILYGFAGLTGFSSSVNRASLMLWLFTTGKLFHRTRDSINLMGVSAFLLLILQPDELYQIGFQLSFTAVGVILLTLPIVNSLVSEHWTSGMGRRLFMIVSISFVVQLGLYPLLVHYFYEFSLIGPVANSLVLPVLAGVVPLSLILIALFDFWPNGVIWLNLPNQWSLQYIYNVAQTLGDWHGSWVESSHSGGWIFMMWLLALFLLAAAQIPTLRWKFLAGFLFVLFFCQIYLLAERLSPSSMEVVVLDVGQGDAIFIKTPNGKHLLIDTGRWSPSSNSGEQVILPFLKNKRVKRLHAIVLTHPHADHLGGMNTLMEQIPIDTIYQNGYPYQSVLYDNFRRQNEQAQIPVKNLKYGDILALDPSIRIFILGPSIANHFGTSPNDHSIVLKLVYHRTSWLFPGDAEKAQEKRILDRYGEFLDSDFLKIAHHGSHTSSYPGFLKAVNPSVSAGSLAFRNSYGHPHPETIHRLTQYSDHLYFTSLEGGLLFESSGWKIERKYW